MQIYSVAQVTSSALCSYFLVFNAAELCFRAKQFVTVDINMLGLLCVGHFLPDFGTWLQGFAPIRFHYSSLHQVWFVKVQCKLMEHPFLILDASVLQSICYFLSFDPVKSKNEVIGTDTWL